MKIRIPILSGAFKLATAICCLHASTCIAEPTDFSPTNAPPLPEGSAQDPIRISSLWLHSLASDAFSRHQGIRAAQNLLEAAGHDRDSIRKWEDPSLQLGTTISDPKGPSLREEGNIIYGIEQPLPLFGKPRAARRVAESELHTAQIVLEIEKQQLFRSIHLASLNVATRQHRIQINEDEIVQLSTWIANAEERLAGGGGSQTEILRLQNERAVRNEFLRTEKDLLEHDFLALNRNLNRPLSGPGSFRPWLSFPPLLPHSISNFNWSSIQDLREPQLQFLRSQWETSKARTDLTRRQKYPELTVGIDGRQYSGDGGFREGTLSVALKFPWLNQGRYRSDRQREQAREAAALAAMTDREWTAREMIHRIQIDLETAHRRQHLFEKEIIPRAQLAVDTSHAAWVGGRGIFLDLMETRRSLRKARLEQLAATIDYHTQMAELQFLTGQILSSTPKSAQP